MAQREPAAAAQRTGPAQRLSCIRRELVRNDLAAFCRAYLPEHFQVSPSRMHTELFALLRDAAARRAVRLAVAAPRGHAKSTIVSLAYLLWCLCYQRERYILLLSATADQAADHLSHLKRELQHNQRLLEDFPPCALAPGARPGPERWRKDEVITRSGLKVTALGADAQLRGRRHRQHRPGLIVLDDVEGQDEVRSEELRQKRWAWLTGAVLKLGDPATNVVVAGTVLHRDSMLARLTDPSRSPGWTSRVYRAVEAWSEREDLWSRWSELFSGRGEAGGRTGPEAAEAFYREHRPAMLAGTRVLWPEREGYAALMRVRLVEGVSAFDAEKQNSPWNPEHCLFKESDLVYWDRQHAGEDELLASVGPHGSVHLACDPSLGGRGGDDTAIVVLLRDRRTKVCYVLDADLRRRRPDEIAPAILGYARARGCARVTVEAVQFQAMVALEVERLARDGGLGLVVRRAYHRTDKLGRLQGLQPAISSGLLRFSRRHTRLIDQLLAFPGGAHDDGPDALEMAYTAAKTIDWPSAGQGRFSV